MRDRLIMLANEHFLLNANQASNAVDYMIEHFDLECSDEGLVELIDESLFKLYGSQS